MKNIILIGFKGCGKTSVGKRIAEKTGKQFFDIDAAIEEIHEKEKGEKLSFREIYKKYGKEYFRAMEEKAVKTLACKENSVIALGGGTITKPENAEALKKCGVMVYLKNSAETLLERIKKTPIPAFLDPNDLAGSMKEELARREPLYEKYADIKIDCTNQDIEKNVQKLLKALKKTSVI